MKSRNAISLLFSLLVISGTILPSTTESLDCELSVKAEPKRCRHPNQGPPGPSLTTAFGSFSTTTFQELDVGEKVDFPSTLSIRNISHPNNTDFIIQEGGYYFIEYGISNDGEENESTLAVSVNGSTVEGSVLAVPDPSPLVTISLIVSLNAGDVVTVVNLYRSFSIGILSSTSPPPIMAFINFIRLAPINP